MTALFVIGFVLGVMMSFTVMYKDRIREENERVKARRLRRFYRLDCPECGLDVESFGETLHEGIILIKRCDHCDTISNWVIKENIPLPVKRPLNVD